MNVTVLVLEFNGGDDPFSDGEDGSVIEDDDSGPEDDGP